MPRALWLRILIPAAILAVPVLIYFSPETAAWIVGTIGFLAPLWLPVLLIWIGWPLWLTFVRSHFVMNIPYSTVELIPGPETPRSARSMELVFYSLYHRTDVTRLSEYLLGHVRVPWGFELYAHAGNVRFFVHVPTAHREAVETRIRSEYRDIEIHQADDYARTIPYNPYTDTLAMREYALAKADPYPLKTYVAQEASKAGGDAFLDVLEGLASANEHEHIAVSFMIRPHQREREGLYGELSDSLHADAQKVIVSLLGPKGDIHDATPQSKTVITAIEAALKKPSFDCGARAIYAAKREHATEDAEGKLETLLAGFSDPQLNGFAPYDPVERVGWPLSELFKAIPALKDSYFLQLFRRRAYFAPPYYGKAFILNTEELATVYRIPHYARASALSGVGGIRLEPPENLPVV